MSRARKRKVRARARLLSGLAWENPQAFNNAVRRREESWFNEIRRRANSIDAPPAHRLADEVQREMNDFAAEVIRHASASEATRKKAADALERVVADLEVMSSAVLDACALGAPMGKLTKRQLDHLRVMRQAAASRASTLADHALQAADTSVGTALQVAAEVRSMAAAEIGRVVDPRMTRLGVWSKRGTP